MAQQYATDAFLLELYPEASAVSEAQRVRWLAYARGIVHLDRHGQQADDAHASMAMHLLALQPGSPLGEALIGSMTLGPGSFTAAQQPVSDAGLELTTYGKHYKLLQDAKVSAVY